MTLLFRSRDYVKPALGAWHDTRAEHDQSLAAEPPSALGDRVRSSDQETS